MDKIAAAAGKEDEDGNDGRSKRGAGEKSSPPPVPTEAPPGMAVPRPLARQHPAEVRAFACNRSSSREMAGVDGIAVGDDDEG